MVNLFITHSSSAEPVLQVRNKPQTQILQVRERERESAREISKKAIAANMPTSEQSECSSFTLSHCPFSLSLFSLCSSSSSTFVFFSFSFCCFLFRILQFPLTPG